EEVAGAVQHARRRVRHGAVAVGALEKHVLRVARPGGIGPQADPGREGLRAARAVVPVGVAEQLLQLRRAGMADDLGLLAPEWQVLGEAVEARAAVQVAGS